MFTHNKRGNGSMNTKEKSGSMSPINNLLHSNMKDSVINNYNVKVNITKKNTKNISIANLTLNNPSVHKGKDMYNLQLNSSSNNKTGTGGKCDNYYYRKSENISPKSSHSPDHELKNANTVLNSPKNSYSKIISKMKTEFQEIASRTHSKKETNPTYEDSSMNVSHNNINVNDNANEEEGYQRVNKINVYKSKGDCKIIGKVKEKGRSKGKEMIAFDKGGACGGNNTKTTTTSVSKKDSYNNQCKQEENMTPLQKQQQEHIKKINMNLINKRLNINTISSGSNEVNDMTSYLTSYKCLMKPHLTNNYSRKRNINLDKTNPNLNSTNTNIDNPLNNPSSSFHTTYTHTLTHPNTLLFQSKQSSFTLTKAYSSYELNTNLLAMSNDLANEKEAHHQTIKDLQAIHQTINALKATHNQTIQDLKDSHLIINYLKELIKTQEEVYIRESINYRNTHVFKGAYDDLTKKQKKIEDLTKQLTQMKGVAMKLIYLVKTDYFNSSKVYDKIEGTMSQLLTENSYLRRLAMVINKEKIMSQFHGLDKTVIGGGNSIVISTVKNNKNNHKRQDTQIVYCSDNDCNGTLKTDSSNFDLLSHTLKEYKSLEKTMKKEMMNQSNGSNSTKYLNTCDLRKMIIPMKKVLCYRRKKGSE